MRTGQCWLYKMCPLHHRVAVTCLFTPTKPGGVSARMSPRSSSSLRNLPWLLAHGMLEEADGWEEKVPFHREKLLSVSTHPSVPGPGQGSKGTASRFCSGNTSQPQPHRWGPSGPECHRLSLEPELQLSEGAAAQHCKGPRHKETVLL